MKFRFPLFSSRGYRRSAARRAGPSPASGEKHDSTGGTVDPSGGLRGMKLDPRLFVVSLLACISAGAAAQDTDADGMPDAWENTWHLNPNDPADAGVDFDLDGLTSLQEYTLSLQGKGEGPIGVWTTQIIPISPAVTDHAPENTRVVGLNDNNDVLVSFREGPTQPDHCSVLRAADGEWRTLSTVGGTAASALEAVALNDAGDVVGYARGATGNGFGFKKNPFAGTTSTDVAPFHLPGETTTPVGSISGINNAGDIIGTRANGTTFFHKAATGLASAPSGWGALTYSALNNQGQAAGSELYDPQGFGATSHFVMSGLSSWHASFPGYAPGEINTSEIDPPDMALETSYSPQFLNDRGEFAGEYRWRIGSPEDEEKIYAQGIYYFDGTGHKNLLPSTAYQSNPEIHGLNNQSQAIISGTDEYGENMSYYLHRKGVSVPLSAITPVPAIAENTYGYNVPTRINNRSTIAGVIEGSVYLLKPANERDGDGMPNDWELFHGLNPLDPADANEDADNDGYTNLEEFRFGGNPNNAANHSGPATHPVIPVIDTDGDGIPDEWERRNFPSLSSPWCAPGADADGDGLTNLMEASFNSDPNAPDTDGDGLRDDLELRANLNPRNTDSNGDGEPDSAPIGVSGGPAHPTWWPQFRYFIDGTWVTPFPWWSSSLSLSDPTFKMGFMTPADKDFEFHAVKWTMTSGNDPDDPETQNVEAMESVVLKIPKGDLESNTVSTYHPPTTSGPHVYKRLASANMVFLRPEEVQNAVPWGLTPYERMIPRAEAIEKGVWARINNDDDDGNLVLDSEETSNPGENDLIEVWVSVEYMTDVIIRKPAGIKIWADKERTVLLADTGTELVIPATTFISYNVQALWIECLEPITSGDLEFSQKDFMEKVESPISKTPIRTYTKMGVGVSGEVFSQSTPGVWNTKAATQGLFDVCRKLYLKGYNVHYYAEPHVTASGPSEGLGAVFNEIHLQTQNCSVTKVVPFGYSHGGSACYQMLNRFATGGFSNSFSVPLSGYVDAISRGSFLPERRFPPLSASHWNMFQWNDFWLAGNTVTNAFPGTGGENVSRLGVVHQGPSGIHHHSYVKTALQTQVELKLK